ncbi:hypothetical protein GQR58_002384 [Nymphon striatum]|nr:hypothetical protein GQR58_002384 [Nymphon striatum]
MDLIHSLIGNCTLRKKSGRPSVPLTDNDELRLNKAYHAISYQEKRLDCKVCAEKVKRQNLPRTKRYKTYEPSIKDATHKKRSKTLIGQRVNFTASMLLKSRKEQFLANLENKLDFINLLSKQMNSIKYALAGITHVIGEDTNIFVLLCHYSKSLTKGLYFRTEKSEAKYPVWDIGSLRSALECKWLQRFLETFESIYFKNFFFAENDSRYRPQIMSLAMLALINGLNIRLLKARVEARVFNSYCNKNKAYSSVSHMDTHTREDSIHVYPSLPYNFPPVRKNSCYQTSPIFLLCFFTRKGVENKTPLAIAWQDKHLELYIAVYWGLATNFQGVLTSMEKVDPTADIDLFWDISLVLQSRRPSLSGFMQTIYPPRCLSWEIICSLSSDDCA